MENENLQKKNKKGKGCISIVAIFIVLSILISSISSMLDQKIYRDNVTDALKEQTYTSNDLSTYLSNTKDSDKKIAKNCYNWGTIALESENAEAAVNMFEVSIGFHDKYTEKVTDYLSNYLKDNTENTAFCCEILKLIEDSKITISDEIKEQFTYKSITAIFVEEDSAPGYSIAKSDFEVYGVYADGSQIRLNENEFEIVDAEKYGIDTIQTIKIREVAKGYETSVKVNCPAKKFFDDYSRNEFANEFYKRMKANGVTGYGMEVDKTDAGVITQVSFYKVIGGFRAYCYILEFLGNTTDDYEQVSVETNGTKYKYYEMQILKEILIGMTFGSADSGPVINKLLGNDGSRTEAGIHYSAYSYDFLNTYQYSLTANVKPNYITPAK